jgi:peptidoglycan/xylan/chitin deacetylase (PgdA/CDA1 family)
MIKIIIKYIIIKLLILLSIFKDDYKYKRLKCKNNPYVRVLMFHDVKETEFINFEAIINNLTRAYNIITPEEFFLFKKGKYSLLCNSILFTFDDGFKSNKILYEKVLKKYSIKSIYFIVSEFITLNDLSESHNFIINNIYKNVIPNSFLTNMGVDDVSYLLKEGNYIGAHTMTHFNLGDKNAPNSIIYDEIVSSKQKLEQLFDLKINLFAYTFGQLVNFSKFASNVSYDEYDYIFTGLRGNNTSEGKFVFRDPVNPRDDLDYLKICLLGYLDFLYFYDIKKITCR